MQQVREINKELKKLDKNKLNDLLSEINNKIINTYKGINVFTTCKKNVVNEILISNLLKVNLKKYSNKVYCYKSNTIYDLERRWSVNDIYKVDIQIFDLSLYRIKDVLYIKPGFSNYKLNERKKIIKNIIKLYGVQINEVVYLKIRKTKTSKDLIRLSCLLNSTVKVKDNRNINYKYKILESSKPTKEAIDSNDIGDIFDW